MLSHYNTSSASYLSLIAYIAYIDIYICSQPYIRNIAHIYTYIHTKKVSYNVKTHNLWIGLGLAFKYLLPKNYNLMTKNIAFGNTFVANFVRKIHL